MKRTVSIALALAAIIGLHALVAGKSAFGADLYPDTTRMAALGKELFFDPGLSANGTQSCAACHGPEAGWTGPDAAINAAGAVYPGALPHRFGNRKPPASAYAGDSPVLHYDEEEGEWVGGMFWDGRATGERLGDPLAEQAQGPYLNPLEQALPNERALCVRVQTGSYAGLFEQVWGPGSLDCVQDAGGVYEKIGRSVAAYERSPEVNPFSSKFDQFWDNAQDAGRDVARIKCGTGGGGGTMGCPGGGMNGWMSYRGLGLTDAELQGLAVFNDPNRANCAACHSLTPGSSDRPLFTDFGYANLGLPKNPENPFYTMPANWNPDGADWVDYGLGDFLKSAGYGPDIYTTELGKFKVPSLRNVALGPSEDFVKAYGHNGCFKSLEEIVFFYHWRAMMDGGCPGGGMGGGGGCPMANRFPPPEVDLNRTTLDMFPRPQVENLVLFLKTLSDGYFSR